MDNHSKLCYSPDVYKFTGKGVTPTLTLIAGTHGDEPAGSVFLSKLVKSPPPFDGRLVVIPTVNQCGLWSNTREVPNAPDGDWDLNRQYPSTQNTKTPSLILRYLHFITASDLVVDFHEGWGYHNMDPHSKGSGIYSNGFGQSRSITAQMIKQVNKNITNKDHYFVTETLKAVPGSLRFFCTERKIPYILVETSGKHDVEPLSERLVKLDVIVQTLLSQFALPVYKTHTKHNCCKKKMDSEW